MNFQNLKTGTQLALSFGAVVALLLVITAVAATRIDQINHRVTEIIDDRAVKVELATRLDQATNVQARFVRNAIIGHRDAQELKDSLERIEKAGAENTETLARIDRITTPQARKLVQAIVDTRAPFSAGVAEVIALVQQGRPDEAGVHLLKKVRFAQRDHLAAIDAYAQTQNQWLKEAGEKAKAEGATAIRFTLAIAALAILLAAGVAIAITRTLMRQLGGEPADAQRMVSAIADGDLTRSIPVAPGDDSSLMARLATMQRNLQRVVAGVRQGSENVATASAQIAQGNQDLSSRTEEQASALQQTAATMEQLGTTARHNADSARQANDLAQGASSVAAEGGEMVGKVVATMQGIHDSSRKIGDIISVIDGIAFQTNILALNAAVEAARAGEQGRGFAVVASEVRTLAQRSAEAAKEIKSLINRSVEQVEQGSTLVDQAGRTMGEIVGSIQRVRDIVAEITATSAEQSSGVRQVGDAVNRMDQGTQQNAALVEQSAAAAESMKHQAQQLVQAVSVFKV